MKLKKLARVVPFGYKESEEQGYLESIPEEIQALERLEQEKQTLSHLSEGEEIKQEDGEEEASKKTKMEVNHPTGHHHQML